jgi:hypothetical protein
MIGYSYALLQQAANHYLETKDMKAPKGYAENSNNDNNEKP